MCASHCTPHCSACDAVRAPTSLTHARLVCLVLCTWLCILSVRHIASLCVRIVSLASASIFFVDLSFIHAERAGLSARGRAGATLRFTRTRCGTCCASPVCARLSVSCAHWSHTVSHTPLVANDTMQVCVCISCTSIMAYMICLTVDSFAHCSCAAKVLLKLGALLGKIGARRLEGDLLTFLSTRTRVIKDKRAHIDRLVQK